VDDQGREYQDLQDWKDNNKLPPGRVSYFADGQIGSAPDGRPNLVTENTHAVVDTAGEHVQSWAGKILPWVGLAAGAVLIASGFGAPIGAGLVAASAAATIGVSAYGLYQGYDTLNDRATHGQSWTDLRDSEVRNAYFGMTADALGILAVGSMLRVGRSGLRMISSAEEMTTAGRVANISSQYADTAAMGNSGATLAIDWEKMTPEQRWTMGAQMGFWGLMTGASAQRNGGLGNLYGKEDFQNLMARMQGQNGAVPVPEGTVPGTTNHPEGLNSTIKNETVTTQTVPPVKSAEPVKVAETVPPVKSTEPVQVAETVPPVKSTEPVKVVEPVPPAKSTEPVQVAETVPPAKSTEPVQVAETVPPVKSTEPVKGETVSGSKTAQTEVDLRNSKEPLHQKASDLDTLYKDAEVAQTELSDATRAIAKQVGGEPLIPSSLKGRERTQEKIQSDYDGDASRITDLARSSVICENPQQVYKALGELESQFKVVRVKDRFEKPVNGYRDMLVNLEMSNGHIVEVQLHVRSVMEVKNGAGHKLYEESRSIYAKAKTENRPLTAQEAETAGRLEQQQKQLYDDAYQKTIDGTTPKPDVSEPVSVNERLSNATKGKAEFNLSDEDSAVLTTLLAPHESGQVLPENLKARAQEPIELSAQQGQQLGIYSKKATLEDVARRLKAIENKNQLIDKIKSGQTGAGFSTEPADKAYEIIRDSTTDVFSIAQNTGIKASNIQKVKDHLFYQEHLLDRYVDLGIPAEMQRFDSDMAIAKIWKRLENGTYTPNDLQLLRHEAAESYLMRRWGDPSYTRAHDRAQQRFPAPRLNDD
jgi:hypothetical protein